MGKEQILFVENDLTLYHSIRKRMACVGINVHSVKLLAEAVLQFAEREYYLVIADIRIFDRNQLDAIQQMRNIKYVPILAISSHLDSERKLRLFQAGVNACIEEPFDLDICVAQAYSLFQLHMNSHTDDRQNTIVYGTELVISRRYRQVIIDGKSLALTRKEFELLHCLAKHPGQVFSREQLYSYVWNEGNVQGSDDTVKVHIKTLRKKLASMGKCYIQNIWGIGYRFVLTSTEQ